LIRLVFAHFGRIGRPEARAEPFAEEAYGDRRPAKLSLSLNNESVTAEDKKTKQVIG
jgi:hypothetical protein